MRPKRPAPNSHAGAGLKPAPAAHSWVACWSHERSSVVIEVSYAGSRENARIEVEIRGEISPELIAVLEEEFGPDLLLAEDDDEEILDVFATEWYREMKSKTTPGDTLKMYRENHGLTQAQLGDMLGGIPRQHVSNMERGIRPVSMKTARKRAKIFKISPGKFV